MLPCVCASACVRVCVCVCLCLCLHLPWFHRSTHTHAHTHTRTHTHTHSHTHTHTHSLTHTHTHSQLPMGFFWAFKAGTYPLAVFSAHRLAMFLLLDKLFHNGPPLLLQLLLHQHFPPFCVCLASCFSLQLLLLCQLRFLASSWLQNGNKKGTCHSTRQQALSPRPLPLLPLLLLQVLVHSIMTPSHSPMGSSNSSTLLPRPRMAR